MYGEDCFVFEPILLCEKDELLRYEQGYLDILKPHYNIAVCAEAAGRGLIPSAETRAKMSAARIGNHNGLGYKHTDEARGKMSATRKGVPFTEEHRRKIGEANSRRVLSEETKAKISASKKGVRLPPRTKEHCAKIGAGLRRHYGT